MLDSINWISVRMSAVCKVGSLSLDPSGVHKYVCGESIWPLVDTCIPVAANNIFIFRLNKNHTMPSCSAGTHVN